LRGCADQARPQGAARSAATAVSRRKGAGRQGSPAWVIPTTRGFYSIQTYEFEITSVSMLMIQDLTTLILADERREYMY
jgi:hypothetical protein